VKSQTPATPTIKTTNRSGRWDLNNFIFCTGIIQIESIPVGGDPNHPLPKSGRVAKKNSKKLRKKLASRWPLPLDRKFERQTALFGRSKKV
jgi:hypothetical protein